MLFTIFVTHCNVHEHFHGWMQKFPTIGTCTSYESGGSQEYSKVLFRQQHFKAESDSASKVNAPMKVYIYIFFSLILFSVLGMYASSDQ